MKAIIIGGSSGLDFEIAKQLREKGIDVLLIVLSGCMSGKLYAGVSDQIE
ncbi:MAG TPA: hypothetical protein VEB00_01570 [Clostridia bacterium]|nr:hypothetical protein [Clostridia bacterium]